MPRGRSFGGLKLEDMGPGRRSNIFIFGLLYCCTVWISGNYWNPLGDVGCDKLCIQLGCKFDSVRHRTGSNQAVAYRCQFIFGVRSGI